MSCLLVENIARWPAEPEMRDFLCFVFCVLGCWNGGQRRRKGRILKLMVGGGAGVAVDNSCEGWGLRFDVMRAAARGKEADVEFDGLETVLTMFVVQRLKGGAVVGG